MGLIIGPLLILYILLSIFITKKISNRQKTKMSQWLVVIICIVFFTGIIAGDAIVGRIYFHYLCKTEGGIHVYRQIELSPTWFGKDEKIIYDTKKTLIKDLDIDGKYIGVSEDNNNYFRLLNIGKSFHKIVDLQKNEVVSEYIIIRHFGGWFENFNVGSGRHCPKSQTGNFFNDLLNSTFIKEHN